jgi:hypothetical protein
MIGIIGQEQQKCHSGVAGLGVDFPAGEGAGTLTVAGTEERSAGGFGDATDENTGALDAGVISTLAEALTFTGEIDFGLGGIGGVGDIFTVAGNLRVVGVRKQSREVIFLGATGAIESEGVGSLGFRVTGDLIQKWHKTGTATGV